MLAVANILFLTFHTGLIMFNVFGWMWGPTRKWNLATQLLTLGSWIGMGAYYGWGYCICTDWHWHIRRELGYHDTAKTYIQLLLDSVGVHLNEKPVAAITATGFIVAAVASLYLNVRDWRQAR